jgi:uncharacterized protein
VCYNHFIKSSKGVERMKKVLISIEHLRLAAVLNDSQTAQRIWDALPITGNANLWGREIHFPIPVTGRKEKDFSSDVVERGDLAFWPKGKHFCIFFGPTPASDEEDIRPASAVNVVGYLQGDYNRLKEVDENTPVVIERIE